MALLKLSLLFLLSSSSVAFTNTATTPFAGNTYASLASSSSQSSSTARRRRSKGWVVSASLLSQPQQQQLSSRLHAYIYGGIDEEDSYFDSSIGVGSSSSTLVLEAPSPSSLLVSKMNELLRSMEGGYGVGLLARIAAMKAPSPIAIENIIDVSLLTIQESSMSLCCVVAHDGDQCVTLEVPVPFVLRPCTNLASYHTPALGEEQNDINRSIEDCLFDNLEQLDAQANQYLQQLYQQQQKQQLYQQEYEQFYNTDSQQLPYWWVDTDSTKGKQHTIDREQCTTLQTILNNQDFQSTLCNISQNKLQTTLYPHHDEEDGTFRVHVENTIVNAIGPAGVVLKSLVTVVDQTEQGEQEQIMITTDVYIAFPKKARTNEQLREIVLEMFD